MSKKRRNKRFNQIKQNPRNVRFEDFIKLLEMFGYEVVPPNRGSHYVAVRENADLGAKRITFPKPHGGRRSGKHMNEQYVKKAIYQFEEIIESEEE